MLIHPLPQRRDLRQQAEHQLNRRPSTRPGDPLRVRNPHERKIPCAPKESFRSPRPHLNAYVGSLVEELQVTVHERIQGVDGLYDFDATVRFGLGGMRFLVVIETKRHKNPIKRELVQVLHDKLRSVGAHQGSDDRYRALPERRP